MAIRFGHVWLESPQTGTPQLKRIGVPIKTPEPLDRCHWSPVRGFPVAGEQDQIEPPGVGRWPILSANTPRTSRPSGNTTGRKDQSPSGGGAVAETEQRFVLHARSRNIARIIGYPAGLGLLAAAVFGPFGDISGDWFF